MFCGDGGVHVCVCARVCAWMRVDACVHACVRARVCVALDLNTAMYSCIHTVNTF